MKKLIISVTLLIVVVSYALSAGMTSIKDYVSAFHIEANNKTMPDSVAKHFINKGIFEIAWELKALPSKDTIVTSDGNSDYALNSDCFLDSGVINVELKKDGVRSTLTQFPADSSWEQDSKDLSGCPIWFYQHGGYITVAPEGSVEPCTLIVNYVASPTYKTDDSMTVQLKQVYSWQCVMRAVQRYRESIAQ